MGEVVLWFVSISTHNCGNPLVLDAARVDSGSWDQEQTDTSSVGTCFWGAFLKTLDPALSSNSPMKTYTLGIINSNFGCSQDN